MTIGIIAAMSEETALLQSKLAHIEQQTIFGQSFYSGKLHHTKVILFQSGMGKVNAAVGTTLLIKHFQPDCIINIGVAGGLQPDLDIGDIIIAKECRYNDVDVTAFGYEYGQMAAMPTIYQADTKLIEIAKQCADDNDNYKIRQGLVVSGDAFINQQEKITFITETFPQAQAVDMESCAIAQVCHVAQVPFAIIRAISDIVTAPANEDMFYKHLQLSTKRSAMLTLQLLENELV